MNCFFPPCIIFKACSFTSKFFNDCLSRAASRDVHQPAWIPQYYFITAHMSMHQQSRNRDNKNSLMDLLENQCVNPSLPLHVPFGAMTHSFAAKLRLSSVSSLQTRPVVGPFVCHPLSLRLSLAITVSHSFHSVQRATILSILLYPSHARNLSHLVDHVPSPISISFSRNPWERSIEWPYVLAHRSVQFGR
jgi:hypothetical protein